MDTDDRLLMDGKSAAQKFLEATSKHTVSIRDQFAMAALVRADYNWNPELCAKWAYELADAMMKAREAK